MKFLVPNYSCLQIRVLPPPDPRSVCPLSSTEFVDPPEKNSWVGHCPEPNTVKRPILIPAKTTSTFKGTIDY